MILIDPRMYERLNSVNGDIRVKSIMDKMTNAKDMVLSSLDTDMSNILTDPYLTDDKKVQRYTSAQTRYNLMNAPASRDESAENAEKRSRSERRIRRVQRRNRVHLYCRALTEGSNCQKKF